jgi:S1-C subfamily serine protease
MSPLAVAVWIISLPAVSSAIESAPTRATVWIRAGDKAVGTGWVIDSERRWIVTARHVLADRETVEVFFQDREGKPIADRDYYLSERADLRKRDRLTTAKLVAKNDNADLALLCAERLPADVPQLSLATQTGRPGQACFSIGHRHDSELLWVRTTGTVRQCGKLEEGYFYAGKRIGVAVPLLFVQSPIEAGESGSALLDECGRVIGVVSAVSNRTPGLAFAVDVGAIRKLLEQLGDPRSTGTSVPKRENISVVDAALHATVWVRPQATEGRTAGVLIDREHRLVLTTASAVGKEEIVDVVAPKWDQDRLVAEASEYRDLLGLRLSGSCVQSLVLHRDPVRDVAILQLDSVPKSLVPVTLAVGLKTGDRVAAVSHPVGEELIWLCSEGSVRSIGKVTLRRDGGDESQKVRASLLQLPHVGSSSGGPVVNVRGELVGILAAREGSRQELAYAATIDEIREAISTCREVREQDSVLHWLLLKAFSDLHDPHPNPDSLADLTRAIELEPYKLAYRTLRAELYVKSKEFKKAVSDLTRITDMLPLNADNYLKLAEAQFQAGDRASASNSLTNAVRISAAKMQSVLGSIRRLGQSLQDDIPNDLERVADWYTMALRSVLPQLDAEKYQSLRETYKKAKLLADVRKRAELLAAAIDELTGAKSK